MTAEVAAGGAQDEAVDPVGVAVPDQLGDRAAHRVADDDERAQPEHVSEGDDVVGTVLQAKAPAGADAAAVAAVVEGDDPEVFAESGVAAGPVEVGRGGEAVEEHDDGRPRRARQVTHERRSPPRQLDPSTGREPGVRRHGRVHRSHALTARCRGRRNRAPDAGVGPVGLLGRVPGVDLELAQPKMSFSPLESYLLRARSAEFSVQGFSVPPEITVLALRWYLRYGLFCRDVEELLGERGIEVDDVTVYRWVERFTPLLADAVGPCRHTVGDRWFVDENYVKVAGRRADPPRDQLTHFGLELVVAAA